MPFAIRRRLLQSAATVVALLAPLAAGAATLGNPTPPAAPANPFYARLSVLNATVSAGPASGKLAVTNLTLTNFDSSPQQVFIFAALVSGAACGGKAVGGAEPQMTVYVQPRQTLVIPYPTALVFAALHPNCIAAEVTTQLNGGSVEVDVTGFVQ
jgi:hypothetical protein